jgi:ribosomal protein L30E
MDTNGNNVDHSQDILRVVDVNHIQCAIAARWIPELVEMRQATDPFSLKTKSRLEQTVALIYLVSICNRLNWDFVLGPFAEAIWNLTDGFSPHAIEAIKEVDFKKAFGNYQRDDGSLNYRNRLENLKAISHYVSEQDLLKRVAETDCITGDTGAVTIISKVPVYNEDPLLKKCNALLHELVRRKLMVVKDPHEIPPAIDYHIMRLYLRTGRVLIKDEELVKRLIQRKRVRIEVITQIRKAVSEALIYTAWLSNTPVSVLNDVEWAYARKACRRDYVWCKDEKCILSLICPSSFLNTKEMITEPDSRHGHY